MLLHRRIHCVVWWCYYSSIWSLLIQIDTVMSICTFSSSFRKSRILCLSAPDCPRPILPFPVIDHCTSSKEIKERLLEHSEDTYQAIVVDTSMWKHDGEEEGAHLFNWCVSRKLLPYRIVFLCQTNNNNNNNDHQIQVSHCYKNGADVVVTSIAQLEHCFKTLTMTLNGNAHSSSLLTKPIPIPLYPLDRRKERLKILSHLVGPNQFTKRMEQHVSQIHRFQQQQQLVMHQPNIDNTPPPSTIRVVHISDTHQLHDYIELPFGNILVHTGDLVGNYIHKGHVQMDLVDQFQTFLDWLVQVAIPLYEQIIFIAGNHDTYLDKTQACPIQYHRAMTLIQKYTTLHPTLHYLQDSSLIYQGMVIYGSPTTMRRDKKRVSNGFERSVSERQILWQNIPASVDILLTHIPPAGMGGSRPHDACPLLTQHVYPSSIQTHPYCCRPKLHCFGHVHSQFGIYCHETTILSNGSQEGLLRVDLYGGSMPIVIDVPLS